MKTRFLFPHWCRILGYIFIFIHIPVVVFKDKVIGVDHAGGANLFNGQHVFFLSTTLLMALGLFLVAFAKEKIEDEQISQFRLDSLQWAIYLNYVLLIISLIFTQDTEHILLLNLLVPLIFFIVHFRWKIYQNNRLLNREEV